MPSVYAFYSDQGRLSGAAHTAHQLPHERQRPVGEKATMIQ